MLQSRGEQQKMVRVLKIANVEWEKIRLFTLSKNQKREVNEKQRKCNKRYFRNAQTQPTELLNCNLVSVTVFKLCDLRAHVRLGIRYSPSPPISSQDLFPRRKKLGHSAQKPTAACLCQPSNWVMIREVGLCRAIQTQP